MRIFHKEVLNTVVYTTPSYTRPEDTALLGSADQLVFQFTASRSSGGQLIVELEHSADGENWAWAGYLLSGETLSDTDVTVARAVYDGLSNPLLPFVRLRCQMFDSGETSLQIIVTGYGRSKAAGDPQCGGRFVQKVFDGVPGDGVLLTDTRYDELLGTATTSLVFHVVAARITALASLVAFLYTSMDGQEWTEVGVLSSGTDLSATEVNNVVMWNNQVSLQGRFVRMEFGFSIPSYEGSCRVYAVGR